MLKLRFPNISKRSPKSDFNSFYLKRGVLQNKPNNSTYVWATFLKNICCQELSKIAQSGLTAFGSLVV